MYPLMWTLLLGRINNVRLIILYVIMKFVNTIKIYISVYKILYVYPMCVKGIGGPSQFLQVDPVLFKNTISIPYKCWLYSMARKNQTYNDIYFFLN